MWFLYLDESGDLGFDFFNKKPSRHLTVSILVVDGTENNRALINAVKKTLKRKLCLKNRDGELKGAKTRLEIKKYFYKLAQQIPFLIFAVTLNKRRVYDSLSQDKSRVYNFISRLVVDKIPFEKANIRVSLVVDRSKSKSEMEDFNQYILNAVKGRLDPSVPLDIRHESSHHNLGLQPADLFSWGIFRKYESKDSAWFDIFKEKVRFETLYLAGEKK